MLRNCLIGIYGTSALLTGYGIWKTHVQNPEISVTSMIMVFIIITPLYPIDVACHLVYKSPRIIKKAYHLVYKSPRIISLKIDEWLWLCTPRVCANVECKICTINTVEVLFTPCNHVLSCKKCAANLSNCPVCRKEIGGKIDFYIAWNKKAT